MFNEGRKETNIFTNNKTQSKSFIPLWNRAQAINKGKQSIYFIQKSYMFYTHEHAHIHEYRAQMITVRS